jgi:hypothetical protein
MGNAILYPISAKERRVKGMVFAFVALPSRISQGGAL